jgi:hypothetical protein
MLHATRSGTARSQREGDWDLHDDHCWGPQFCSCGFDSAELCTRSCFDVKPLDRQTCSMLLALLLQVLEEPRTIRLRNP